MKKLHLKRIHRKTALLWGAVVVALLLVGYGLLSAKAWSTMNNQYQATARAVKATVDQTTTQTDTKAATLAAFEQLDRNITQETMTCDVSPLITWQRRIISSLQEQYDHCKTQVSAINDTQTTLHQLVVYLQNDSAVTKQLQSVGNEKTETEKSWPAAAKRWQTLHDDVATLPVEGPYQPTKQAVLDRAAGVTKGWQALIAANKSKNATKFNAAESKLTKAYQDFDKATATNKTQLGKLTDKFNGAYHKAF